MANMDLNTTNMFWAPCSFTKILSLVAWLVRRAVVTQDKRRRQLGNNRVQETTNRIIMVNLVTILVHKSLALVEKFASEIIVLVVLSLII